MHKYILILLFLLIAAAPVRAQDGARVEVAVIPDAELVFEQGLEAYRAMNYERAARRFRIVVYDYPLHRMTTAALLMQGKALYQNGEYERAALALETLAEEYPTSSYLDEARQIASFVDEQIERVEGRREVLDLGILLPLGESSVSLTQHLFDGIHLAVREFNSTGERPVRMVFQATDGAATPRAAVDSLVAEDVDLIIGPLFSGAAYAAGRAADEAEVLLIAPMATADSVSAGRTYVFQANPTITMRGRKMAEFGRAGLMVDTAAVIFEANDEIAATMARSFSQALRRVGGTVAFEKPLPESSDWYELGTYVRPGQLDSLQAVYLPIVGSNADRSIGAALNSLERLGVEDVRVLGNSAWHDLPIPMQASDYKAAYSNEFYPDTSSASVQAFEDRYAALAGNAPDRLGYTGYDLARYLLALLKDRPQQPLYEVLREAAPYRGLGLRFNFQHGNTNEGLYFFRYRFGQMELLR